MHSKMHMLYSVLYCLCYLATINGWRYDDANGNGPSTWAATYPLCNGSNQSPVDIITRDAVTDESLGEFTFTNYLVTRNVSMSVRNSGTTASLVVTGTTPVLSGGGLPDNYIFTGLHFHWGSTDDQGSEHTVNGVQYPMEMHISHYAEQLGSYWDSYDEEGGLAVVTFLFEISDEDNEDYEEFVSALSSVPYHGNETEIDTFPLKSLFSSAIGAYFRYNGSLTGPSCFESIIWTIFEKTIPISSSQLEEFRTLTDRDSLPMVNNFRPIEELNERTVLYFPVYADDDDDDDSCDAVLWRGTPLAILVAVLFSKLLKMLLY